jgi:hypothetical protein
MPTSTPTKKFFTFDRSMRVKIALHRIPTYIVFIAFLGQLFSREIIEAGFYMNRSAYLSSCENRDRPIISCGGKCQLIKQLKQEDRKDRENPERRADLKPVINYFENPDFTVTPQYTIVIKEYSLTSPNTVLGFNTSPFHPPQPI